MRARTSRGRRRVRVDWAESAVADLEEATLFIALDDAGAAAALGERILARTASLSDHPLQGRLVPELLRLGIRQYRELVVGSYRIVYRLQQDRAWVLVVVHGARDVENLLHRRLVRTRT